VKRADSERSFWMRTRFVFYVALIAAALVAIAITLSTNDGGNAGNNNASSTTSSTGSMFLQSLSSADSHKAGDVMDVTLYENSGSQAVNALQSAVRYPAEKLALVSVTNGVVFSEEAATDTNTAGIVRIARSIKPGSTPVKGAKPVVTLEFKALTDSDSPYQLSVDQAASLLVRASDSKNILSDQGDNNTTFDL